MAVLKSHEEIQKLNDAFNEFMIKKWAYSKDSHWQIIDNGIDSREMWRCLQEWKTICRNDKKKQCQ